MKLAESLLQLVTLTGKQRLEVLEISQRNVKRLNRLAVRDEEEITLRPQTIAFRLIVSI